MKPQIVLDRVYMVGDSAMTDSKDCSVYLIDVGDLVLIDTGAGMSTDKIIANIESFSLNPARLSTIILTHCHIDHVGGALSLRQRFNAKTVMHEKEAAIVERGDAKMTAAHWYGINFKPLPIDLKLKGEEERLSFGNYTITCLHTPGHSPGSISAYIDIDGQRVLFGQDIHGPFLKEFGADMVAWTRSMELLLSLNADVLCEGHFGVYRPASAVHDYIERYLDEYGVE